MSEVIGPAAPHILETEVGGEISLFDPESQEALVLNATASDIWRLSDGQNSADEIVELIARAYGVDPEKIRDDVLRTIEDFRERGLLSNGGEG